MDHKQKHIKLKAGKLHPRNAHKGRYDFDSLCTICTDLKPYLKSNPKGDDTIDFSDAEAVLTLNKALLSRYYNIKIWNIPEGYLTPAVPGRANYIHYAADLISECRKGVIPTGKKVKVLDIGTGASCIYPIIGSRSYGWKFIGTDIDPLSLKSARNIVESNSGLSKVIKIIHQKDNKKIFNNIIRDQDQFDLTICNPPFHESQIAAEAGNKRKWKNLSNDSPEDERNFGGHSDELWCDGGELAFIKQMIDESTGFGKQVCWFTSLVSKKDNVQPIKKLLSSAQAVQIRVIKMEQGQKNSRFIAWSFLTEKQQETW